MRVKSVFKFLETREINVYRLATKLVDKISIVHGRDENELI